MSSSFEPLGENYPPHLSTARPHLAHTPRIPCDWTDPYWNDPYWNDPPQRSSLPR
ncbi:hypothetical protein STRIP9103_02822 [Streptomyces ipomoeae 91-03]|uniref:Uncharacterized protein n=1 Tax=Streptomyces ipomoeae 91-03 TaxID=698759 RepID=L1L2Z3_9ACTN|nr:hypothetical protein STRIP9103_02822 [Streptomyces ipomoeae 91-03]